MGLWQFFTRMGAAPSPASSEGRLPQPSGGLRNRAVPVRDSMWQQRLRAQLEPSTRACEHQRWSADQHRPDVAFCIAGVARTLALPLTQRLLHLHLLRSFAGSNESALFMLLKTDNTNGSKADLESGRRSETSVADLENLLRMPWLRTWLQEAVVVNGSGTTAQPGQGWGGDTFAVESDELAWHTHRAKKCTSSYTKGTNEGWLVEKHARTTWPIRTALPGLRSSPCHRNANSYVPGTHVCSALHSQPTFSCLGC